MFATDNCKDCVSRCMHAGKDREFVCPGGVSCKITKKRGMTNAQKIRAMSDEELAELLISADFCEGCEYCDKVGICRYFEAHPDGVLADGCRQATRKWLHQPAKEDT